jgi:SET family sugar efflux transporter-like MFS transporter
MRLKMMNKIIFGLFLFNCCYMAAMGFTASILPLYALEFGAEVTTIGPIWTASSLVNFAMAMIWGSISDKRGKRMFHVIVGASILSLICLLYASATSLRHIVILMIFEAALGSSQALPAFMTIASELSKMDERGKTMGFFWMGGSVGWAISVSLAGLIAETYGIRRGFYFSTFLYLLSVAVAKIMVNKYADKTLRRDVKFKDALRGFKQFSLTFIIFWLATICFYISDIVKISYVLIFFEQELGLNRESAAFILSLGTWAEIPVLPLLGSWSDKIGRKPLILIGLFAAFAFNVSISISQNALQAICTMLLLGISWGAFTSASSALIGDIVDEGSRAKAMALYGSSSSIASIIAPSLMSLAILKTNFRAAFNIIAIIVMIGFLLISIGLRKNYGKKGGCNN